MHDSKYLMFFVEDDLIIQNFVKVSLEDGGFEVTVASSNEDEFSLLEEQITRFS